MYRQKKFKLFAKIWIHCHSLVFDNDLHFTDYDEKIKNPY